jgi:hypothetical protein
MTEPNRARVVMHFGDGSTIDTWNTLSMRDTFTDPLGELTFESFPPSAQWFDYRRRLAKGELVTVLVNDVSQGGFLIQSAPRTISKERGCGIKVTCHTPLITPYQGDVDPDLHFKSPTDVPVIEAVLAALAPYGFEQIQADASANVNAISGVPIHGNRKRVNVDALKHADCKAHEGETAYAFCARIFTRLGVCLRCAADGTLLLSAPNYAQAPAYTVIQSLSGGGRPGDYFVGEVQVHDSNDGQYSECTVRGARGDSAGQTSTSRPTARVTEAELHPNRPSYTSFAAAHKPKIFRDKSARDHARALSVAKFELGLRAASAYAISGEVDGWISTTGRVWTVDTMVHAIVDAEQLDESMWLLERVLHQDSKGGQRTHLKLLPKGALLLGDVPA